MRLFSAQTYLCFIWQGTPYLTKSKFLTKNFLFISIICRLWTCPEILQRPGRNTSIHSQREAALGFILCRWLRKEAPESFCRKEYRWMLWESESICCGQQRPDQQQQIDDSGNPPCETCKWFSPTFHKASDAWKLPDFCIEYWKPLDRSASSRRHINKNDWKLSGVYHRQIIRLHDRCTLSVPLYCFRHRCSG